MLCRPLLLVLLVASASAFAPGSIGGQSSPQLRRESCSFPGLAAPKLRSRAEKTHVGQVLIAAETTKVIVCGGSSCNHRNPQEPVSDAHQLSLRFASAKIPSGSHLRFLSGLGRCRGAFDPVQSFKKLAAESDIEIEEVFCMNMCKRGPNVRLVNKEGEVVTFEEKMNETELRRLAFQGVGNDARLEAIWGLAVELSEGSTEGIPQGAPPAAV